MSSKIEERFVRDAQILEFNDRLLNYAQTDLAKGDIKSAIQFSSIVKSNIAEFIENRLFKSRTLSEESDIKEFESGRKTNDLKLMILYSRLSKLAISIANQITFDYRDYLSTPIIEEEDPEIIFDNLFYKFNMDNGKSVYGMFLRDKSLICLNDINANPEEYKEDIKSLVEHKSKYAVDYSFYRVMIIVEISEDDSISAEYFKDKYGINLDNVIFYKVAPEFTFIGNFDTLLNMLNQSPDISKIDKFISTRKVEKILESMIRDDKKGKEESITHLQEIEKMHFGTGIRNRFHLNSLHLNDTLIHCPYDSYDKVLDFIFELATNDKVRMIAITLYRVAKNSKILDYLHLAAMNKKMVYIYSEISARGNERANLDIIDEFSKYENVVVRFKYKDLKVHSKFCLGILENGRMYAHIGTGNYNEDTAKFYKDYHLFTSNPIVTNNLYTLAKNIMGIEDNLTIDRFMHNIEMSPLSIKDTLIEEIQDQIQYGSDATIMIKCNHIYDKEVIKYLKRAAKAGVEVVIIARTTTGIYSGDHIKVISRVGKYLEHERVFIFGRFGSRISAYISSADILKRNFSRRVELMVRIISNRNIERLLHDFYRDIIDTSEGTIYPIQK